MSWLKSQEVTCFAKRRNFVARKEGFTNTWMNYFPVYVRDYGSKDSQSANELSSDEAGGIPTAVQYVIDPFLPSSMWFSSLSMHIILLQVWPSGQHAHVCCHSHCKGRATFVISGPANHPNARGLF